MVGLANAGKTDEVDDIQPPTLDLFTKVVPVANQFLHGNAMGVTREGAFETVMIMGFERQKVTGEFDFAVRDCAGVHLLSIEVKKLIPELSDANIAQTSASMQRAIDIFKEHTGYFPRRHVALLTSGRQWIMVVANRKEGRMKWVHTSAISVIADNGSGGWSDPDRDASDRVAAAICFAFQTGLQNAAEVGEVQVKDFEGDGQGDEEPGEGGASDDDMPPGGPREKKRKSKSSIKASGAGVRSGGKAGGAGGGAPSSSSRSNRCAVGGRYAPLTQENVEKNRLLLFDYL
jgi:hypothetical protein